MYTQGTYSFNPPSRAAWSKGNLTIYGGDSPGSEFFVNSNTGDDANNSGASWQDALATIDAAVNKCTASAGDKIFVHPNHSEVLAADSAIDIDVAGVQVIGITYGQQRPTLAATAIAGDCKLAAAGVSIQGMRFQGNIDATTGIVEVSAADCALINCEYLDGTGQATDIITTTTAADRLLIDGLTVRGSASAGANSAIALNGADFATIRNFYLYGNFAVGAIDCRTTASSGINIHSGKIWTENAADIAIVDTITGSTGFIGPDIQIMLQDNAANITTSVTGATFQLMDPVYVCNLAGEKGMLIDWTASTNA